MFASHTQRGKKFYILKITRRTSAVDVIMTDKSPTDLSPDRVFDSLSHVFAMEHGVAAVTLEAPDMPLPIKRDQCLTFPQLVSATGTGTRVGVPSAFRTGAIADRCRGLTDRDTDASVTQCLTYEQYTVEINEIRPTAASRGVVINLCAACQLSSPRKTRFIVHSRLSRTVHSGKNQWKITRFGSAIIALRARSIIINH